MLLDIVTYPDPRLKEVCAPIQEITEDIRRLAADMLETMYAAPGVGLAAPQVGRNIRMLVMDPSVQDGEKNPRVLINPVLALSGEEVRSEAEGCLSVPMNYRADVKRMSKVHLTATWMASALKKTWKIFPPLCCSTNTTTWTASCLSTKSAACGAAFTTAR